MHAANTAQKARAHRVMTQAVTTSTATSTTSATVVSSAPAATDGQIHNQSSSQTSNHHHTSNPIHKRIRRVALGIVTAAAMMFTPAIATANTTPAQPSPTAAANALALATAADPTDHLIGAWDFENVKPGDRSIPSSAGNRSATAQLNGDGVSIIASGTPTGGTRTNTPATAAATNDNGASTGTPTNATTPNTIAATTSAATPATTATPANTATTATTATPDTTPTPQFGNVLHFGADASSYMSVAQYVNTGADNTSFAMWYRYDESLETSAEKSASTVLLQQSGSGRSLLTLRPTNQYHTYVNAKDVLSTGTVTRGDWQHVIITFDQTARKAKFYINGILDSEQDMGTAAVNQLTDLLIGTHKQIGNTNPHSMRGDVDDIRVYDTVLSDAEAKAVYARQGVAVVRGQLAELVDQADDILAKGELGSDTDAAKQLAAARDAAQQVLRETGGSDGGNTGSNSNSNSTSGNSDGGETGTTAATATGTTAQLEALANAATKLKAAIAAYNAQVPITITADTANVERTIDSKSIFGINHRYAFNGYGTFDPDSMSMKQDFTDLYKKVGFGSIRYPGGTISNLFNWKTTLGPRAQRLKQIHGFYNNSGQGGIEPNFGIGEIATFADQVNSEIVYVYSLGRGNAQDAADLVEYLNAKVGTNPNGGVDWAKIRADNGHPEPYNVRYFEIGNEMQQAWAGLDGTASQGYWTTSVEGGSEKAYTEGGTATFTKQYAVALEDWNKAASAADGKAGLVRYMRYANVNPKMLAGSDGSDSGDSGGADRLVDDPSFVAVNRDGIAVYVGTDAANEQWRIVDDLATAGPSDKVVEIDYATGAIRFGDGTHGAIPTKGQQIYVSYSVKRDGFIDVSKAIKRTTDAINAAEGLGGADSGTASSADSGSNAAGNGSAAAADAATSTTTATTTAHEAHVYSSYQSEGFISRMTALGANEWYDGLTIHPYSGTPSGSTTDAWYDDAMKKAENVGIAEVRKYVDLMPKGKVPVISEYGIFRDTNTLVRSQSHALYIAKVALEYVRLGSPYIQKHCLVDWYSSGADSLGPTQQAVIQAVPQAGASTATGEGDFGFFLTPSAYVLQMLNDGFGDSVLATSLSSTPTLGNGVASLSALASADAAGSDAGVGDAGSDAGVGTADSGAPESAGALHVAVTNVDRTTARTVRLDFGQDLTGRTATITTLDAAIDAENTLDKPDTVVPATQSVTFDAAKPLVTIPAHSFTTVTIQPKKDDGGSGGDGGDGGEGGQGIKPGVINAIPVITAEDVTLTVGDSFNPLTAAKVDDREDGSITLTASHVVFNNVNTSKAGTYHVTYRVSDSKGATATKTITVTVKAKSDGGNGDNGGNGGDNGGNNGGSDNGSGDNGNGDNGSGGNGNGGNGNGNTGNNNGNGNNGGSGNGSGGNGSGDGNNGGSGNGSGDAGNNGNNNGDAGNGGNNGSDTGGAGNDQNRHPGTNPGKLPNTGATTLTSLAAALALTCVGAAALAVVRLRRRHAR